METEAGFTVCNYVIFHSDFNLIFVSEQRKKKFLLRDPICVLCSSVFYGPVFYKFKTTVN